MAVIITGRLQSWDGYLTLLNMGAIWGCNVFPLQNNAIGLGKAEATDLELISVQLVYMYPTQSYLYAQKTSIFIDIRKNVNHVFITKQRYMDM